MSTEPIRWSVYIAAALAAVGTALLDYDAGQSVTYVIGQALLALTVVFGGGEIARNKAWSPRSHGEAIDAELVIAGVERGVITRAEARERIGVADDDGDDAYLDQLEAQERRP